METFKTMTCRKSVRSYKSTLSDANLQKILMAAQAAPIGMGKYDTMHMTVIRNTELLQELDRNAAEFFGDPSRTPLYNAPCRSNFHTDCKSCNGKCTVFQCSHDGRTYVPACN